MRFYSKLVEYIKYKANLIGIKVATLNESYTSKCDALNEEPVEYHDSYTGRRIKRGLFLSGINKVVNADINGAINILRKYLYKNVSEQNVNGESFDILNIRKIINSGFLFNPIKLKDLYSLSYKSIISL